MFDEVELIGKIVSDAIRGIRNIASMGIPLVNTSFYFSPISPATKGKW
jgi:hypothetical protein